MSVGRQKRAAAGARIAHTRRQQGCSDGCSTPLAPGPRCQSPPSAACTGRSLAGSRPAAEGEHGWGGWGRGARSRRTQPARLRQLRSLAIPHARIRRTRQPPPAKQLRPAALATPPADSVPRPNIVPASSTTRGLRRLLPAAPTHAPHDTRKPSGQHPPAPNSASASCTTRAIPPPPHALPPAPSLPPRQATAHQRVVVLHYLRQLLPRGAAERHDDVAALQAQVPDLWGRRGAGRGTERGVNGVVESGREAGGRRSRVCEGGSGTRLEASGRRRSGRGYRSPLWGETAGSRWVEYWGGAGKVCHPPAPRALPPPRPQHRQHCQHKLCCTAHLVHHVLLLHADDPAPGGRTAPPRIRGDEGQREPALARALPVVEQAGRGEQRGVHKRGKHLRSTDGSRGAVGLGCVGELGTAGTLGAARQLRARPSAACLPAFKPSPAAPARSQALRQACLSIPGSCLPSSSSHPPALQHSLPARVGSHLPWLGRRRACAG